MEFRIPDTAKAVAVNTAKVYRRHLNRIATVSGVDTVEKIVNDPKDVVYTISLLILLEPDEDKRKTLARIYYSAIFYAMAGHPYLSKPSNILRTSFHTYDPRESAKGTEWVKLAAYKKKLAE